MSKITEQINNYLALNEMSIPKDTNVGRTIQVIGYSMDPQWSSYFDGSKQAKNAIKITAAEIHEAVMAAVIKQFKPRFPGEFAAAGQDVGKVISTLKALVDSGLIKRTEKILDVGELENKICRMWNALQNKESLKNKELANRGLGIGGKPVTPKTKPVVVAKLIKAVPQAIAKEYPGSEEAYKKYGNIPYYKRLMHKFQNPGPIGKAIETSKAQLGIKINNAITTDTKQLATAIDFTSKTVPTLKSFNKKYASLLVITDMISRRYENEGPKVRGGIEKLLAPLKAIESSMEAFGKDLRKKIGFGKTKPKKIKKGTAAQEKAKAKALQGKRHSSNAPGSPNWMSTDALMAKNQNR